MVSIPSLAVLPLRDLDGSSAPWFVRGFAEDLVTELSRCQTIEVVHPWSSHATRDADATPAAIGHELGASHLLDGSVRRDSNTLVAVAVRLVEAASGRQLWAERLHASATEAPAIQLDIATRVAGALAAEFDRRRLAAARRCRASRRTTAGCEATNSCAEAHWNTMKRRGVSSCARSSSIPVSRARGAASR